MQRTVKNIKRTQTRKQFKNDIQLAIKSTANCHTQDVKLTHNTHASTYYVKHKMLLSTAPLQQREHTHTVYRHIPNVSFYRGHTTNVQQQKFI